MKLNEPTALVLSSETITTLTFDIILHFI